MVRILAILPLLILPACERTSEATKASLGRTIVYKYAAGQDDAAQRAAIQSICGPSAAITRLRGPVSSSVPGEFESTFRCEY